MTLLLLVLAFIFYQKNRSYKKNLSKSFLYKPDNLKEELNPNINTLNSDLHKNRPKRFGRYQYKGLTFFINEQENLLSLWGRKWSKLLILEINFINIKKLGIKSE